ncbi:zinc finger protein [Aphelenchoides avenae]|nr:zinc finger protein [Aphelenchus avenae]
MDDNGSNHPIWKLDLFRKESKELAKCLVCSKQLKLCNASIKALKTHLNMHPSYLEKYNFLMNNKEATTGPMDNVARPMAYGALTSVDKAVVHLICCNYLPFTVVNHPTFKMLFGILGKGGLLRDEKHYRELVLPRIYRYVRVRVLAELNSCKSLSLTMDIWSNSNTGFIRCCSLFFSFPGEHTSIRTAAIIEELLAEWQIPREKCHCFLHDQGSNMIGAFAQFADLEDADCGAHVLHNAVRKACFPNENKKRKAGEPPIDFTELEKVAVLCRSIVGHFRHSVQAKEKLTLLQREKHLPEHALIQDVKTRWDSTHDMVGRLLEQKVALDAYFVNMRRDLLLSEAQWSMLEELQELLEPAAECSRMLCRDDAPLSMQITVRRGLVDELNSLDLNILGHERDRLVQQISHRMAGLEQYRSHAVSHFLDPRFKDGLVENPADFRAYVKQCMREIAPSASEVDVQFLRELSPAPAKRQRTSFLSSRVAKASAAAASASQPVARVDDFEVEMNTYLREPVEDFESNPLDYWRENEQRLPVFAGIAKKFLGAGPRALRRSSPKKAEMIVFLSKALPYFRYKY